MKYISTAKPLFPATTKPRPVLQDWILYLPQIVQSDLLKSLRGCDTPPSPDYSKFLVKEIRREVMQAKNYQSVYFRQTGKFKDNLTLFVVNIEKYNLHFITHLLDAIKILAYCSPEEKTRSKWAWIQVKIYTYLNINPETPNQMKQRYANKKKRLVKE